MLLRSEILVMQRLSSCLLCRASSSAPMALHRLALVPRHGAITESVTTESVTPKAFPSLTGVYRLVPLTCGLLTDTAGPGKTRKRSPWGHRIAPAPAAAPARVTAGLCRYLRAPAAAATACTLSVDGAAQTMKRCGHEKQSHSLERESLSEGGPSSLSEGGLSEPVGELVWRRSVDRGRRTAFSLP